METFEIGSVVRLCSHVHANWGFAKHSDPSGERVWFPDGTLVRVSRFDGRTYQVETLDGRHFRAASATVLKQPSALECLADCAK